MTRYALISRQTIAISLLLVGTLSGNACDAKADASPASLTSTPSGLQYVTTQSGTGAAARSGETILYRYVATLADGTVFEDTRTQSEPNYYRVGTPFARGEGLRQGLLLLREGDRATLIVPPHLGYGDKPSDRPKVPANSTLRYEVELIAIKSRLLHEVLFEEIERDGLGNAKRLLRKLRAEGFPDVFATSSSLGYLASGYAYRFHQYETAAELCKWNLESYPDDSDTKHLLATINFLKGNHRDAILLYQQALQRDPKSEAIALRLAMLREGTQRQVELEKLKTLLDVATGPKDVFLERPLDLDYLRDRLDSYLSKATPAEAATAAELVERLMDVIDTENSRSRDAIRGKYLESPMVAVRQIAIRGGASGQVKTRADAQIDSMLKQPINLSFTSLDGDAVDVSGLKGKVVLLFFWAAWSPASERALPGVRSMYDKYHTQGLEIIGISLDSSKAMASADATEVSRIRSAEEVLRFSREKQMKWPQYYEGAGFDNSIAKRYWIASLPALLLFDQSGMLAFSGASAELPRIDQSIQSLLQAAP